MRYFLALISVFCLRGALGGYIPGQDVGLGVLDGGVPTISPETVRSLRHDSRAGIAGAQYHLALLYLYGEGIPASVEEAVRWFRAASRSGHNTAMVNLALLLAALRHRARGGPRGITFSDRASVAWLLRAAEDGNRDAQWMAGVAYLHGVVPYELPEVVEGDGSVGGEDEEIVEEVEEDDGSVFRKSEERAEKWFKLAAEGGSGEGMFYLGVVHEYGSGKDRKGVPDLERALQWYTKSCETNHVGGCLHRGLMLAFGRGQVQSFVAAREALRRAVTLAKRPLDRAPAEYFLAVLAAQGRPLAGPPAQDGEAPDYETAAGLLERVAASNHPDFALRALNASKEIRHLIERSMNYTAAISATSKESSHANASDAANHVAEHGATNPSSRKIADAVARHQSQDEQSKDPPKHTKILSGRPRYPPNPPTEQISDSASAFASGAKSHPQLAKFFKRKRN